MTVLQWPKSSADLAQATWDQIQPYYDELASRPLGDDTVEEWLAAWSDLEAAVSEAAGLAMIAYTADTADPAKLRDHLRFSTEIVPRMDEHGVRLARRLLALGYDAPEMQPVLARFRNQITIFREANVPLFARLEELGTRYQEITGALTVEFDGATRTVPQLAPFLKSPDRAIRERAFRAVSATYLARRDELAELFDRMYALRARVAHQAGFADFEQFSFAAKCRFDYTPADCARFHAAVEEAVAPAVARLLERRRRRLGLEVLRPWDLAVDPDGQPPLRPFRDAAELQSRAAVAFTRVEPGLGEYFRTMIEEGLLDLESRRGKAPGGYCETLQHRGRPYVHMNAVGLVDDVGTLLHEAGHCFHAFLAHKQPYLWQRHPTIEMAELASMSMELLAFPHLGEAGFFSPADLRKARREHLEDVLLSLSHIASVDAFQSWVYTSGEGHDAAARDAAWLRLRERFEAGVDWTALEQERSARWYRQLHIFLYPFYYIEYGLAQLGALQVWRNSLADPAGAVARYREALALGATRPLPALYQAAGARLTVDVADMAALVALVEEQLAALDD